MTEEEKYEESSQPAKSEIKPAFRFLIWTVVFSLVGIVVLSTKGFSWI